MQLAEKLDWKGLIPAALLIPDFYPGRKIKYYNFMTYRKCYNSQETFARI
jgi:hypothetical protein